MNSLIVVVNVCTAVYEVYFFRESAEALSLPITPDLAFMESLVALLYFNDAINAFVYQNRLTKKIRCIIVCNLKSRGSLLVL